MSKLAEGTTTRYFCCKIQADGLNFESIMLSTGKGRKGGIIPRSNNIHLMSCIYNAATNTWFAYDMRMKCN